MKRIASLIILCILTITLAGCGGNKHEGEAKTPSESSIQKGRDYQDVIDDFKGQGFTNIQTEVLDDLVTGWMVKDGEVESVSVDGDEGYSSDSWYQNDVEVVITYHTFPDEEEVIEQPTAEPSELNKYAKVDEILTIESNKDLATLFANGEDEELCKEFIAKYKGRIIEFDGNIAYMTPNENNETRYDFLIYAGDFSNNSSTGSPAMQFKDKNVFDLNLTGENIPESIGAGDNLHIIAEVDDLINSYLIILKPISTEIR